MRNNGGAGEIVQGLGLGFRIPAPLGFYTTHSSTTCQVIPLYSSSCHNGYWEIGYSPLSKAL